MDFSKRQPIAVIDSGVGGISVLRELVAVMPNENFIYFGDSLHAPYGTKSLDEVRALTKASAVRLFEDGAKALVVACNTATTAAVRALREEYPEYPIVGIEPAVKPAATCMEHPRVLVMATPMTIHEEKLRLLISRFDELGEILPLSCPGLMDFVERGEMHGEALRKYLEELLYPYCKNPVDAVVLGCTHYPFVKDEIKKVLGENVRIFDGGRGTALELQRRVRAAGLETDAKEPGKVIFDNSLSGEEKKKKIVLCENLLYNTYK